MADDALLALTRFGLGPRPGDLKAVGGDPRGFVLAQCGMAGAAVLAGGDLQPTEALIPAFFETRRNRKLALMAREAAGKAQAAVGKAFGQIAGGANDMAAAGGGMEGDMEMAAGMAADAVDGGADGAGMEPAAPGDAKAARRAARAARRKAAGKGESMAGEGSAGEGKAPEVQPAAAFAGGVLRAETEARYARALSTDAPLVERLVMFWSNHFCVSGDKGGLVRVISGAYEREAIRPHVLGRFRDLLGAAVTHPAMLIYLDNNRSVGPNSARGQRKGDGLNENLARELLELHSLGVDGGYDQADVGALARILTGWTVDRSGEGEAAVFRPAFHEPGAFTVLGRTYAQPGGRQLQAALDDLARHPATARHVARKLVRHFVADDVPPGLADGVAKAFRDSDGDLAVTTRALVAADAAWAPPPAKARSPYELVVAAERATGAGVGHRGVFQVARSLGQKIWSPPSPAGFSDADDAWLGGDALLEQLDWATAYARTASAGVETLALGDALFGAGLDGETRTVLKRAESEEQALALLIMSPAFQRR